MRNLSMLLLIVFVTGCIYSDIRRLPLFELASKAPSPVRAKLFYDDLVDWTCLPELVPYAVVTMTHDTSSNRETVARMLWWKGIEEKADVVRVLETVRGQGGLLYTEGVLYRIAPVKLGFWTDRNGMVIRIDPEGDARKAGLLEGDKVIFAAGAPYSTALNSTSMAFYLKLWILRPGDQIDLVWIRGESGRMEGKITCGINPPIHLSIGDSIPWKEPPPPSS